MTWDQNQELLDSYRAENSRLGRELTEARELLSRLNIWAGIMGGWVSPVWKDTQTFLGKETSTADEEEAEDQDNN